jgi:hypothetical protein
MDLVVILRRQQYQPLPSFNSPGGKGGRGHGSLRLLLRSESRFGADQIGVAVRDELDARRRHELSTYKKEANELVAIRLFHRQFDESRN